MICYKVNKIFIKVIFKNIEHGIWLISLPKKEKKGTTEGATLGASIMLNSCGF